MLYFFQIFDKFWFVAGHLISSQVRSDQFIFFKKSDRIEFKSKRVERISQNKSGRIRPPLPLPQIYSSKNRSWNGFRTRLVYDLFQLSTITQESSVYMIISDVYCRIIIFIQRVVLTSVIRKLIIGWEKMEPRFIHEVHTEEIPNKITDYKTLHFFLLSIYKIFFCHVSLV
jgi:hypothetical protein